MPSGLGTRPRIIQSVYSQLILSDPDLLFALRGDFMILTGGGTTVSRMVDQGPGGNDFTSAGSSDLAYVASAIDGQPGIRAQAANQLQNTTLLTTYAAGEIFIVSKIDIEPPAGQASAGIWRFGTDNSASDFYPFIDSIIYDGWGSTARKNSVNPTRALTLPNVYNVSSAVGAWTNRLNNVVLTGPVANAVAWTPTKLLLSSVSNNRMAGVMCESIMFSTIRTTQQRIDMYAYFKDRYPSLP